MHSFDRRNFFSVINDTSHYVFLKFCHSATNEDKFNIGTIEIFNFEIDDKKFTLFFSMISFHS